ncbi:uncharacterized protein MEPE_06581 [Melanopsichium pennsylvanicum]|uniref:FHA domain-containing protein n=2 Tax=Melanopsichium pennsylvanicum TaxID=63383 RepID=A0AAJ5C8C7_9BASI|nr:conserved hypothetical protein [Melanopsichium pennsylvanicum 4]SNX87870.1 uncharacterized protein MEPE_06581 [Melanopsichium pennsylvanicum]
MLNTLRRSFGMSPSSSNIQADYIGTSDVSAGVISPSNRPNTFVPLRRSNSFTNFFSSSRPSSPVKEDTKNAIAEQSTLPAKPASSEAPFEAAEAPVLAFLILLDKKGRQKQRFPIQCPTTTIGRADDNDLRIFLSEISRHHCTIQIEIDQEQGSDGTTAFLHVMGANGVMLNGTQAYPAPRGAGRYQLHTGHIIVIARRSFVFELPPPLSSEAQANIFNSPEKLDMQSAVPQTPNANKRRVRMSLVNAAQIDTPARPSATSSGQLTSPSKAIHAERDARRANSLQRFMQFANVSPSKDKKKARQSLTSSTSTANIFATPVKSRVKMVEPKTAPPKQVSFSLYSNLYPGRLSPVKQMRMMPPLGTMTEEQDGSFRSDDEQHEQDQVNEDAEQEDDGNESSQDIVILEELEQEQQQQHESAALEGDADALPQALPAGSDIHDVESAENAPPSTSSSTSTPNGSSSKSGSPKRAKRRSSFFGRAGPFRGMSLGFYAEERAEPEQPAHRSQEPASTFAQGDDHQSEEFSDASDVEPSPMQEENIPSETAPSPIARRVVSRPMKLGISKTPSPVKKQQFVGLTPMPRRPRLSLTTRRKVSLRTQTLLRSSEAYADRLFLPPPPPAPVGASPCGLSKSMSMPSKLSVMARMQPFPAFDTLSTSDPEHHENIEEEDSHNNSVHEIDFEAQLDPAFSEEEHEPWEDSEEDEDEVDQSLSVLSPSPQKTQVYNFSPVKSSAVPQFATPQPASKTHVRRISMQPAGPSIRSALIRLQISGAGERMVHEASNKTEGRQDSSYSQQFSPTKSRKVVRVSDVGLPPTELSMGFDVVEDSPAEQESTKIASALHELFTAEEEQLTDDELDGEEAGHESIVQISSSKAQKSPFRRIAPESNPLREPQTPAALNSVRHLFSAYSAAPNTPDMQGLGGLLNEPNSPEQPASSLQLYGTLGDRMRAAADPEIAQLLSPITSTKKKTSASPVKSTRRGVRRSEAAELVVPLPATPRAMAVRGELPSAAVTPLPEAVVEAPFENEAVQQGVFEAELHVTMIDTREMDAQNETIACAFAISQGKPTPAEEKEFEDLRQEVELEQAVDAEVAPVEQLVHETKSRQAVAEEFVAQPEGLEKVSEPAQELDAELVSVTPAEEVVPPVVALAVAEEFAPESATEEPEQLESSPSKSRASGRATSASPKKRAARSSPVKRAPASKPEIFAEEIIAEHIAEPAVEPATEPATEPVTETAKTLAERPPTTAREDLTSGPEPTQSERESPTKPARRGPGSRKAKQAASSAISATPHPEAPLPSPVKPSRRSNTAAANKVKLQAEEAEQNEAEAAVDVLEEAPKRTTRARATKATTTAPTKGVRATRTRTTKKDVEAVPSSSAGYGDDEASDDELQVAPVVKGKRSTTTRARTVTTARAKGAKTLKAAIESSEAEDIAPDPVQAEEDLPAAKPRTRTTRGKADTVTTNATTTTTAKSRAKAKAAERETEEVSSASTTTTTRSGRTTRRTTVK